MSPRVAPMRALALVWGRAGSYWRWLSRRGVFKTAFIAISLAILYWGFAASDRYVSEADVIVERTNFETGQTASFASLLVGGGGNADLLMLRKYLLSTDMLDRLDSRFNLRAHYSDRSRDPLSRMWFEDGPREWFYSYYLSRIEVAIDDASGSLHIRVQAYTPETAHAVAGFLVTEGELFINELAHRIARGQVEFLEKQVEKWKGELIKTRGAVLAYQNAKGLVSPQATADTIIGITGGIETKISGLKAQRQVLLGFLSPDAPDIRQLDIQILALEHQLARENARLASSKGRSALNRINEEYQRLLMEAEIARDIYRTALVALERGRIDATRSIKKISVLQMPTRPDYPLEPRRIYNILIFVVVALLLAGILHLFTAIIRDHQD